MKKHSFTKKIARVALLFLLPLTLAGCSASQIPLIGKLFKPPAPKQVNLIYWGLFEPETVFQSVIEDYQKLHPNVTISYSQRPVETLKDTKETLVTRLSQKSGDLPDMMRIHSTWVAPMANVLAPSDMSEADFTSKFYPVAKETCVVGGQVLAVPLMYDGLGLFYNKDIFAEEKIDKPPANWDDFQQLAVKLTKLEGNTLKRSGAAIGLADTIPHAADIFGLMLAQSQVTIPADLDSRAAVDALTFYVRFYKDSKVWNERLINSLKAFANGETAMIFAPSWRVYDLQSLNPTLKFGVAPVPQAPSSEEGNLTNINWASFWVEAVAKTSANPKEAWEFLKYLSTPEVQRKLGSEQGKIRSFGEPFALRELSSEAAAMSELIEPIIEGAETAKTSIITDASGNDQYTEAITKAIEAAAKGTDPQQALTTAKNTLTQLLGTK
ncbi:MAG: extracellular solute-binding protein [bacterium]|nr:extracellular solute-binding protein [bacterium]